MMLPQKATQQLTKQHNRDLVLKTIIELQETSRAEVARVTHLTRTTVSDVVNGLLAEGLVEEVGRGESLGGKSPILLSIVADSRYLIGLNLAQDKFIGAIVNLRGEIKEMVEAPVHDDNGENALNLVYQIIDQLMAEKDQADCWDWSRYARFGQYPRRRGGQCGQFGMAGPSAQPVA